MDILEKINLFENAFNNAAWPTPKDLETFLHQYIETALWSSTDESDEPMDKNYGPQDIDSATLDKMKKDCLDFMRKAGQHIIGMKITNAAHDFWLNRNGHGAGFWDGDWPEVEGKTLDKLSESFGTFDLYVGDDGKIHGGSF